MMTLVRLSMGKMGTMNRFWRGCTPRNRSKLEEYSVFLIFPTIFLRFPHLPYVFPLYHSAPYSSFSFGGICSMTGIFPGRGIFLPGRGIFRGKACTFFSFSVVYILISCFAFRLVLHQTRRVNDKSVNSQKFTTLYLIIHSVPTVTAQCWVLPSSNELCNQDTWTKRGISTFPMTDWLLRIRLLILSLSEKAGYGFRN